jgi:HD-like signal output (HDOD) protein
MEQWVAFLKDKAIPVLPETPARLATIGERLANDVAPKDVVAIVLEDPYLALKLLLRAEGHRSRTLGRETTTALGAVLQTGIDGLSRVAADAPPADTSRTGLSDCVARAIAAARLARAWASLRSDISSEEVALAALLSEAGELLLWHFAPELPGKAIDELRSGRALRSLQAQQQAVGFSFKQLSLALVDAWTLPSLIAQLIRGADTPRANIARLAGDTARHVMTHPENPAIPADIVYVGRVIPSASLEALIAPLPVSTEYKQRVMLAVMRQEPNEDIK